jgi:hypothetical protein
MRIGMSARREIYQGHCRRYQKAGKTGKGKILEELTGTAGLNRDRLAQVPASYGKQDGVAAGQRGTPMFGKPAGNGVQGSGAGGRRSIRRRRSSGC